jgi:signal-transduction protein with cAMP-binding, CBS, and nucleotidyltransferase domain
MSNEPVVLNVSAYMTSNPITVTPEISFFDAVTKMYQNGIGNLIVVKDNEVIGLLSERQIIQYLVTEKIIHDKPISHVATSLFTKISPDTSLLDAAKIRFEKKRKLLVFDNEKLVGILSTSDMLRGLRKLSTAPRLDKVTAPTVYTCSYDDSLFEQIKLMNEKRVGSVIVTKDDKPYGIFTERDLICNILAIGADMSESVGQYSSHPLVTAEVGINFHDATSIMADKEIKRLPLTSQGQITAIVCACDLLRAFETQ